MSDGGASLFGGLALKPAGDAPPAGGDLFGGLGLTPKKEGDDDVAAPPSSGFGFMGGGEVSSSRTHRGGSDRSLARSPVDTRTPERARSPIVGAAS